MTKDFDAAIRLTVQTVYPGLENNDNVTVTAFYAQWEEEFPWPPKQLSMWDDEAPTKTGDE